MNEQQERSAFEAELFGMYEFYSDRPHFERYTDGDYIDSRTHKFWRIWQARAALAANVPQYSDLDDPAHELWAVAQLPPGQGITDGVERIKAVLLAARGLAANVPAGFVLVPVEPTPGMVDAGREFDHPKNVWAAMLAIDFARGLEERHSIGASGEK